MTFDALMKVPSRFNEFRLNEVYFDGKQRLDALGVSIPPQMRVLELIADWPRTTVETLDERLTVEGFSIAGDTDSSAENSDRYERRWQTNNLDSGSSLLHTEAFVQGLGYAIVGPGEAGIAKITTHSRLGIAVRRDPTSAKVIEAVQRFKQADGSDAVMYYEPGKNTLYQKTRSGQWAAETPMDSGMAMVPVIPFANRSRIRDQNGRSEMADVIRYTDACSRTLTNLQVGVELLAMPQRYLLGGNGGDMFKDKDGNPVSKFEIYMGHLLTGPQGATAGQFQGANLDQIISTVKLYAQLVSGSTGMPLSMLGIASDANPTSAAALNVVANRHIKKAEKKQAMFGDSWEDVMRAADSLEGVTAKDAALLETRWRDASTPTLSDVATSTVGLVGAGIIPAVVARDLLPLTPEQKRLAAQHDDDALINRALQAGNR